MFLNKFVWPIAGAVGLAAAVATQAMAGTADISVTSARIAAGKLLITGTTAAPNTRLRLDGQTGAEFNVTSKPNRTFSFSVVYLPEDCIVSLHKLTGPAVSGAATDLVVANCGRAGVSPRGAWNQAAPYLTNDLVTHLGSTWRAKRDNTGIQPVIGADWEQFAAKGEAGAKGATGATGATGGSTGSNVLPLDATGPAGGDLAGTYPNPTIRLGAVVTNRIADLAVTTPKIATGAITTDKLAQGAVGNFKIKNDAVTSIKILDGAVGTAEIADNAVTSIKILDGAVGTAEIADSSVTGAKVLDETLNSEDLAANSVGSSEIQTDAVNATEIANDSIDSGEIVDFGLSNQDIGVLFAEVNSDGTIANSSGSVTGLKLGGTGQYEIDFGRNIRFCTAVATIGPASTGSAAGQVNVADRAGNTQAIFVDTNNSSGSSTNLPFRLVVVC